MMNSASRPERELLAELLLQWEELYERGQDTPSEELAKDHPDLVPELTRRIKALKTVAWIKKPLGGPMANPQGPTPLGRTGWTLGDRYRLDELVAEGGFAEVYRAYDTELQRIVAVKIPKPSRLGSAESFLAEARRVASLKHDGIVPVYDVGVEGDICFIVSEFLEGGSLADRLTRGKPSREEAVRWIGEIADALEYAHINGIVHRDIKPANILIDQHGRAKLADFGIAQSSIKTGGNTPSLGTLRYMSPEQLEGKPADHRSDIYSLGLVLYESLTGDLPYSSPDPSIIRREIAEGRVRLSSSVPSLLASCIRKATSRSPYVRHASAIQFACDLRRMTSLSGVKKVVVLLLSVVAVLGLSAIFLFPIVQRQELPAGDEQDPILGKWNWFTGEVQEILPGGKIKGRPWACWKVADPVERRYVISWNNGLYVDALFLSDDGMSLRGKNNEGLEVGGDRVR
jgi:serine/threonine protein kinase